MIHRAFSPFPILKTERLTLRQLSVQDAQPVFLLRSDKDINQYLDRPPSKTIDDAIGFIQNITERINRHESIYWAITWAETETFVGSICLFEFTEYPNKCEIGYELLSDFQGKGIMKEAASRVIEYATQTLRIQRIEAFTHKDNLASIRLLEQLGFKKSTVNDDNAPDHQVYFLEKHTTRPR